VPPCSSDQSVYHVFPLSITALSINAGPEPPSSLYSQTTTSEADFQALASSHLVDDEEQPLQNSSVFGRDKTVKALSFFKEVCILTAIESKTLRSLYSILGDNTFPDLTIVLQIEEELVRISLLL
jgi:hypothetical protein